MRITFIGRQIGKLFTGQAAGKGRVGIDKPLADGIFTGMAKWRVADIMTQGGGLNDGGHVIGVDGIRQAALFRKAMTNHQAKRPADTGNFKTVSQAGMDIVIFGQRVNLGLALQAPEGGRENDTVIVLVKIGPAKSADT